MAIDTLIGIAGIVLMILLLLLGVPIGISLLLAGVVGIIAIDGLSAAVFTVASKAYDVPADFILSAIPLFILMGHFAFHAGAAKNFYSATYKWVGRLPGGIAIATVLGCGGFAAASGSSLATATVMGTIALPEMRKYNYDAGFGAGSIAAGGTIGSLIPPSILFILYGILTDQSIGKLFMAGFFPGILEVVFYSTTIVLLCSLNPRLGPRGSSFSWREKFTSLGLSVPMVAVIIVVLGGIYGGVFTPTEAAGIGSFSTLVLLLLGKKGPREIKSSLLQATSSTAMLFLVLIGAIVFSDFMTVSGLPKALVDALIGINLPPQAFLLLVLAMYIPLGCVMDAAAMLIVTLPFLLPMYELYNFNLIWTGVLMIRVMEIAMITPPIGMTVFVISGIAPDIPIQRIFRGIVPFLIADLLLLVLLVTFPWISLFLPSMMK